MIRLTCALRKHRLAVVWRNWERFSGGEGIQTGFQHLVGSVRIEKRRARARGLRWEGVGRDFMQVDAPVCSPSCRAQRTRLSPKERRIQEKSVLALARRLLRYAVLGKSLKSPCASLSTSIKRE